MLTPALREMAASFASMTSSGVMTDDIELPAGLLRLTEGGREAGCGPEGSKRVGATRVEGARRGKSGSKSSASEISGLDGGLGVLAGGGAIDTGWGETGDPLGGDTRGAFCNALTAVPFQTVTFGLALILSTCIGSALVPLRSKGGKSVVLGAGT